MSGLLQSCELKPSSDRSFKQFKTMVYGVRALMRILLTYYNKYRCDTVAKIITRYAPSIENNTSAYISFVCKRMHTEPNTVLRLDIKADLFPPVEAICKYESGYVPTKAILTNAFLRL